MVSTRSQTDLTDIAVVRHLVIRASMPLDLATQLAEKVKEEETLAQRQVTGAADKVEELRISDLDSACQIPGQLHQRHYGLEAHQLVVLEPVQR